jgi:hypothetical protein
MAGERVGPEGRPWYAMWFWRSLVLLALGLALVALGEVRAIAAGGGAPAPVLPDYTLLLPNLMVLLGSLFALLGAAAALATGCAALLNAARGGRRRASASRRPVRGTGDRNG